MRFIWIVMVLFGTFILLPNDLSAQCPTSWAIKDECGPITANGGIAPGSPPIFCEGQVVTFLNNTDPGYNITKVYMDWGDGTCEVFDGNPASFTHAYDVPDDSCISVPASIYHLYMGVEKSCGGGKKSFHYIITPLAVSFKPVADPIPPQTICQNEPAIFLNQCNTPSNTTTVWTSSDGTTLNGETFTHTFNTPGNHLVTMNVTNMCGSDMATIPVTVTPLAVAKATVSDSTLCLPDATVTVTNLSENAVGQLWSITPNINYIYLNGTGPGSANPQIQFTQPGIYTLKLIAVGCGSPTWTKTITVSTVPAITLDTIPNSCTDVTIDGNNYFTSTGGQATSYQWTFTGGLPAGFAGANAPAVTFSGMGLHVVTLSLGNHCGSVTKADSFYILPPATAGAMLSDTVLCIPGDKLTITNTSTNAQSYIWWVTPVPWGGFMNGTGALSANPVLNFTSEGLFTIHLKVFGCGNPKWESTVRVRRKPSADLIKPIEDGCFSVVLDPLDHIALNGGQPDYINWTFLGGQPGTANGPVPPAVLFPDTGYHFVRVVLGNVCGADTVSEDFTIFNPTTVTATAPVDSLCRSYGPVQLQAIPSGGFWSGPGVSAGGTFDPAAGLNNAWNQLIYNYGPPDCRIYDTVRIFVMSTSVDAGIPVVRCVNAGLLTLTGQTPAGGQWSGPGIDAAGVFNPAVAGAGVHLMTYTIIDANGCPNSDSRQVIVKAAPDAALATLPNGCVGAAIEFGAFATTSAGTNCNWSFGDGATGTACYPYHTYFTPGTYTVELIVTNPAGCRDTASTPIVIHDLPDAGFATDQHQGCADLTVKINNTSIASGPTSYSWNYGDGWSDSLSQPGQHVYKQGASDTTYLLELTASNHCGMTIFAQEITVFPQPQVQFATDIDDGCSPLKVKFHNLSVGDPKFYRWYINGVLVDTSAQLPTQVFFAGAIDSLYRIILVAGNDCGNDTLQRDVIVHPNLVHAFLHLDTTVGCAPLTITATNFSIQGYYATWDFGDGNYGVGDTVKHTFTKGGAYLVQLFVNNGCGYDTASMAISVLAQPDVNFVAPPYTCYGDTLSFVNTSGGLAGCYWYFGDGTTEQTVASPSHMYAAPGQYSVTMIGFAITSGCPDTITKIVTVRDVPVASIQLPFTSGCEPFTITPANNSSTGMYYLWNFGDGCTSTLASPTHTYLADGQFQVSLKVMDEYGCSDDTTLFPVMVHPKPELSFNLHQGPLCTTPLTLTFTNNSAQADAYEWVFGNGLISTAVNPVFDVASGPLDILLTGQNMYGCRAVLDTQVSIYSEPMVSIITDQIKGCVPFTVFFEPASHAVNHFKWDFDDGQTSADANPVHTFREPGTYRVRVVADHDGICFDSSEILITVFPSPEADFTYEALTDTTVSANGIFRFHDASANAVSWHWDFGDGNTSDLQDPVHRYMNNGDKPVMLIAVNHDGCPDTARQIIRPEPFGSLFIPNTFSPELGADGAREFRPVGTGLRQFKIEVYATNGQLMWASDELDGDQPVEGWDGTFKGELCPPGIYWWKASAVLANGRPWNGMSFNGQDDPIREGKLLLIR